MLASPIDTLAYVYGHRLFKPTPCHDVPVSSLIPLLQSEDSCSTLCPDQSAARFYLLNHALGTLRAAHSLDEPLGDKVQYFRMKGLPHLSMLCIRAFVYLFVITSREARHVRDNEWYSEWPEAKEHPAVMAKYPGSMVDSTCVSDVVQRLHKYDDISLRDVVATVCAVFEYGRFNSGYGGGPWHEIALCLQRFVEGEYTGEQMLDTVWTLAHNGGPIFNKGMYFGMYQTSRLFMILDVQAAGMIPQAFRDQHFKSEFQSSFINQHHGLLDLMVEYPDFRPDAKVSWETVASEAKTSNCYENYFETKKPSSSGTYHVVKFDPLLSVKTINKKRVPA